MMLRILVFCFATLLFLACHKPIVLPIDAFNSEYLQIPGKENARTRSDSDIRINLRARQIQAKYVVEGNVTYSVLSIPVEITNASSQPVKMIIPGIPGGGIWSPTDLMVSVRKIDQRKDNKWRASEAYQIKNSENEEETILQPDEKRLFDIQLNWTGTGSVPTHPLIKETDFGEYSMQFLLFFKSDLADEYIISDEFRIEVE